MANSLIIHQHNFAPHPVSAVFSATGGSGWSVTPYSFLVVAWYSAEETDIYCAGAENYGLNAVLGSFSTDTDVVFWNNKTPSAATDTLTITWSAPDGRTPHHYSVYWQLRAAYDLTEPGTKANAADIPPSTTSYTLTSPADESAAATAYVMSVADTVREGPVLSTNGAPSTTICTCGAATFETNNVAVGDYVFNATTGNYATVVSVDSQTQLTTTAITGSYTAGNVINVTEPQKLTIYGDQRVSLGAGIVVDTGGTNGTILTSKLVYNARGWNTEITFDGALPGGATLASTLNFNVGYAVFLQPTPQWGPRRTVVLSPVQQLDEVPRQRYYRNYNGHSRLASFAQDTHVDALIVTIPTSGVTAYSAWAGELQHWLRSGTTLWIVNLNGAYTDTEYGTHPQYIGTITSLSYLGSLGKNSRQLFTLNFSVDSDDIQSVGVTFDQP